MRSREQRLAQFYDIKGGALIKKKINFPHIQGNSEGSSCKVIYEEGRPNICGNARTFSYI